MVCLYVVYVCLLAKSLGHSRDDGESGKHRSLANIGVRWTGIPPYGMAQQAALAFNFMVLVRCKAGVLLQDSVAVRPPRTT